MTGTPQIRASDSDRDAAVSRLRAACIDGRLDLEEFTERLDGVSRAVTQEEIVTLTSDLEVAPPAPPRGRTFVFGIFGGSDVRGRWRAAPRMTVVNVFGGSDLDLCEAVVPVDGVTITVISLFGGSDVLVPEGADVTMTGLAVFGGNDANVRAAPVAGAPRVTVRAYSLFGGSDVTDRPRRTIRERLGLG